MGRSVLLGGQSADVQKICFQTAKCPDMGRAKLQGGLFTDYQE